MSSTESTARASLSRQVGRAFAPAGLIYVGMMLIGLAVGLWPRSVYLPAVNWLDATLPALRGVVVAQATFVLLVYPLVMLRRRDPSILNAAAESIVLMAIALPLLVAAACLADATTRDVVRTQLYVASLMPPAWAAGAWMVRSRDRAWIVTMLVVIASVGLPWAMVLWIEFFAAPTDCALSYVAPLSAAWRAASTRVDALLPGPVWSVLAWPVLGLAGLLVASATRPRPSV